LHDIFDASCPSFEDWRAKGTHGIDDDLSLPVRRHVDEAGISVRGVVFDTSQVLLYQGPEDPLATADNDQLEGNLAIDGVPVVFSEVVQQLSTVRVELLRCESVVEPEAFAQCLECRADSLHGHTTASDCSQDERFGEANERDDRGPGSFRLDVGDDRLALDFRSSGGPPHVSLGPSGESRRRDIDDARGLSHGVQREFESDVAFAFSDARLLSYPIQTAIRDVIAAHLVPGLARLRSLLGPQLGRQRVRNVQKRSETTNNATTAYLLVNRGFRLDLSGRLPALKCPGPAFQAGNASSNLVGTANLHTRPYHRQMSSIGGRDAEELLLRLGEFGSLIGKQLAEVAGDELAVHNPSLMLLCRLDLYGPLRPNEIAEMELMTTGGVSKLIDRMVSDGFVERKRGVLSTDQRAVLVVITRRGRDLIRRLSDEVAGQLAESELLVKELNRLLEPIQDLNQPRRSPA
jgi:DNA-binding MarR family transcriptional regulator